MKKNLVRISCVILVLSTVGFYAFSQIYTVPIMMYHKVDYTDVNHADTVSPENLRKQFSYLKNHGFHVISIDELAKGLEHGRRFPFKTVAITFDDGYENNFTNAFPIIKEFKFPVTIFISTDRFGKELYGDKYMSLEEILLMKEAGITFGSHGMTQAYLPDLSPENQRYELNESRRILGELLKSEIFYYAYPVGGFNESVKKEVAQAGYKAAFTTNRGSDRFDRDKYEINRIRFSDKDNSDVIMFFKLSGYYNLFRELKSSE